MNGGPTALPSFISGLIAGVCLMHRQSGLEIAFIWHLRAYGRQERPLKDGAHSRRSRSFGRWHGFARRNQRSSGGDRRMSPRKESQSASAAKRSRYGVSPRSVDRLKRTGTVPGQPGPIEVPEMVGCVPIVPALRPRGAAASVTIEDEIIIPTDVGRKQMLVRVLPHQTQVVVLEGPVLVEHYVAGQDRASAVGNIYLGKVRNVLPGMEAAFIDFGASQERCRVCRRRKGGSEEVWQSPAQDRRSTRQRARKSWSRSPRTRWEPRALGSPGFLPWPGDIWCSSPTPTARESPAGSRKESGFASERFWRRSNRKGSESSFGRLRCMPPPRRSPPTSTDW